MGGRVYMVLLGAAAVYPIFELVGAVWAADGLAQVGWEAIVLPVAGQVTGLAHILMLTAKR